MSHWTPPWTAGEGELVVFDFDNTLFRSPLKPDGHAGGWWGKLFTLAPPLVPDVPGDEWWNDWVVEAAHRARSSGAKTILLTGRIKRIFRARVEELLAQKGLEFDFIGLHHGGQTQPTFDWKVATITDRLAGVTRLTIYEDRPDHVDGFRRVFGAAGIPVNVVHVT